MPQNRIQPIKPHILPKVKPILNILREQNEYFATFAPHFPMRTNPRKRRFLFSHVKNPCSFSRAIAKPGEMWYTKASEKKMAQKRLCGPAFAKCQTQRNRRAKYAKRYRNSPQRNAAPHRRNRRPIGHPRIRAGIIRPLESQNCQAHWRSAWKTDPGNGHHAHKRRGRQNHNIHRPGGCHRPPGKARVPRPARAFARARVRHQGRSRRRRMGASHPHGRHQSAFHW